MFRQKRRRHTRISSIESGSTTADFAPVLFVIFIVFFFPMLNFIGLTWAYGMCWYFNYTISHEIARSKKIHQPAIVSHAVDRLTSSGMASFLGIKPGGIKVLPPAYDDTSQPPTVQVTTSLTAKPFISVPWFGPVPGLNAPMTFTVSTRLTRGLPM